LGQVKLGLGDSLLRSSYTQVPELEVALPNSQDLKSWVITKVRIYPTLNYYAVRFKGLELLAAQNLSFG
jgi:hypothetical protein